VTADDRTLAEAVIRRLCVGAQIDGVRFGPVPQLLVTDHATGKPPIHGQVYLNLASTWRIYPERPAAFPRGEDALPEYDEGHALQLLLELREAEIAGAELSADAPDLIFTFADGRVFFLNGRHERYETWQLGVAHARDDPPWLVVACPGDEVAVWAPPGFDAAAPAV
jgi:hypothetical protein